MSFHTLRTFAFVLSISLARSAAVSAQSETIDLQLEVGEQRVLPSTGVTSYSEGVSGIIDVRLTKDGRHFVIVGQRAGTTSLLLMRDDGRQISYRIRVGDAERNAGPPDHASVEARDNVRLDFYFVQLQKDYQHRLGLAWPASVSGSLSASFDLLSRSFTEASAVVTDQALPRLDMAQTSGWAKLMRQATVVTANGTEARFTGGGEVNVPITVGLTAGLTQIAFGSQIQVLPRYDRDTGRIELVIRADISDLASDMGTGIPGRVTSTLHSVVNLELGQSVALAGLSSRSESTSHTGLPFLSQIPIVGGLFGTHQNRSQDTENIVLIVPTVVDAVSLQARTRLLDALRAYRDFDGDLGEVNLQSRAQPQSTGPSTTVAPSAREETHE